MRKQNNRRMPHAPLARFTAALLLIVSTASVVAAVAYHEPIAAEMIARAPEPVAEGRIVPVSAPADPAPAPAPTTTTTTAPPPTTAPPTTTPPPPPPPTTAPPVPPAPTTTAPPPPPPPPPPPAPASSSTGSCESQLLSLMNDARANGGVGPAIGDGAIHPIAERWSEELARSQNLRHNPDYGPQIFAARPEAQRASENVGRTMGSVQEIFQQFMASSGHRANIMSSANTHVGLGCVTDGGGQLWVTMNFWG